MLRCLVIWLCLGTSSAFARDLPWLYTGLDAIVDKLPDGVVAPDAQASVVADFGLTLTMPVKASLLPQSLRDLLGHELVFFDFDGKRQCARRLEGFVARAYLHGTRTAGDSASSEAWRAGSNNLRLMYSRIRWTAPPVNKAVADEDGLYPPTFGQLRELFHRNSPRLVATFSGGCDVAPGIIALDPRPLVKLTPIATDKALVQTAATMARATRMWPRLQAEYTRSRDAFRAKLRKRGESMARAPRTWDADGEVGTQVLSGPGLTLVVVTFGNNLSCRVPRAWFAYEVHTAHMTLWSWGLGDQPTFIDADHDGNYEIKPDDGARLETRRTTLAEPHAWRIAEQPTPKLGAQADLGCQWDERTFGTR